MKNALAVVMLSTLLAACAGPRTQQAATPAGTPDQPPPSSSSDAAAQSPSAPATAEAAKPEEVLPSVPLSNKLLFRLLTAEIANQRGDWRNAYGTMLSAAEQTRDPRLASRATEIALAAKKITEAQASIKLWRALAPDSEEANQYFLSFAVLSGNLDDARQPLEQKLRNANPAERGPLMLQIQRLLSRARDKAAAFRLLETLVTPYLSNPDAHLALSQGAYAGGDNVRAAAEARLALQAKPDSTLAILALAQSAADKEESLKDLQAFLKKYPNKREVRVAYARLLTDARQYDQASAEFETLLKADPHDLTTLFALGVLNVQTGNGKAAEGYLKSYLTFLAAAPDEERDPAQALMLLSQIAEERKDNKAALDWLAQIEPGGELYISAQVRRAELIAKDGNVAGARKLLADIDTDNPRDQAQVVLAEARILREGNQWKESYAMMEAAAKRFPENADVLYEYAMSAEKLDKLDVMETALRKVMEIAPDNHHAYNALGYSLAERNLRLPEALELISKALALAPQDPFIIDSMGWVQFRLGRLKEAEDYLRRAYALRPDAEIGVHLGEVLWVKGQKADAQEFLRAARSKDPQNDALKNTLARLHIAL